MRYATLLLVLMCLALPSMADDPRREKPAPAGEEESAEKAAESADSPLVAAAKAAKAAREKDGGKRPAITNHDVRKSTGKLIESTDKPLAPLQKPSVEPTAGRGPEEEKKVAAARQRVASLSDEVTVLEKEMARLTETYYTEDDPDFREDVVAKRFEQTKRQLESVRKSLAEARDQLAKVDSAPPRTP